MKEILNELENKNEVSLASINNKKHDKTNNMQYIFSVHIIYIYFAIDCFILSRVLWKGLTKKVGS